MAAVTDIIALLSQVRREYGAFGTLSGETLAQMDAAVLTHPRRLESLADAWYAGRRSVQLLSEDESTGPKLQALCRDDIALILGAKVRTP